MQENNETTVQEDEVAVAIMPYITIAGVNEAPENLPLHASYSLHVQALGEINESLKGPGFLHHVALNLAFRENKLKNLFTEHTHFKLKALTDTKFMLGRICSLWQHLDDHTKLDDVAITQWEGDKEKLAAVDKIINDINATVEKREAGAQKSPDDVEADS